jgi:hypothetical protein
MTVLSQLSAVIAAAALLSWRARARGWPSSIRSIAVSAVIVILTVVSLSTLWAAWERLRDERRVNSALARADAVTQARYAAAGSAPFVEALNQNLPAGAPFYVQTDGSDAGAYQWLTFRLFPRVAVSDPGKAHWIVFLRTVPPASTFKSGELTLVMQFAPDLVLAERRG